jgi:hypothetical protein
MHLYSLALQNYSNGHLNFFREMDMILAQVE